MTSHSPFKSSHKLVVSAFSDHTLSFNANNEAPSGHAESMQANLLFKFVRPYYQLATSIIPS